MVGCGATARSVTLALASLGMRELTVLARRPQRADVLLELADALHVTATVQPLDVACPRVDVLANTIPAEATAAYATAWAAAAQVLFDAIYDPWPTPLAAAAPHTGAVCLSGLDLLAGQAVDQFYLFTGKCVTFEQCKTAAQAQLGRRRGL